MSFSKAKILRFNDIKPCAPSPSKYNIVNNSKPKCAVIPQSERFAETESPTSSESGSIAGSTKSVPGSFKTPTLPKKKKLVSSASKVLNVKELFTKPSKFTENEALKEKIIECENKSQCILDLTQDIEELKGELGKIKAQKDQLLIDRENYEQKIERIMNENKKELTEIEQQFQLKVKVLKVEKMEAMEELNKIKQEYKSLREENQKDLAILAENCEKLEKIYSESVEDCRCVLQGKQNQIENLEKKLFELEKRIAEEIEKYKSEIDKLQREHQNEIQEIEFEMLKTMTELQKEKETSAYQLKQIEQKVEQDISNLKEKHDNEKQQIILDYEEKLKTFSDAANLKVAEIENLWKEKLNSQEKQSESILKECQAISEYNIIQSELEKNKFKTAFETKSAEYEELEKRCNSLVEKCERLKAKYLNFEKQLEDTKEQFTKELEIKDKELKQKSSETKAYQITISNSQNTIEVLKKRLINSDRDVEQLKQELMNCEKTILELESKCLQLSSDLKQSQTATDELEMQFESNVKLNKGEIKKVHEKLLEKVDFYKNQVKLYSQQIDEEKSMKNEVMQQLSDTISVVNKINSEIEVIKNKYEEQIEQSETKFRLEEEKAAVLSMDLKDIGQKYSDLEKKYYYYKTKADEYEEEIKDISLVRKKYIEQSGRYDDLLQKFQNLLSDNETIKREKGKILEENKAFRLKQEEQRAKLERLEESEIQQEALRKQVVFLEEEVSEIAKKYADIVGHQNTKQKIKHLVDIKERNEELLQNKIDLELKLNNHLKITEKLKKENADLRKCLKKYKIATEDKENIGSPNRSSPFRERN